MKRVRFLEKTKELLLYTERYETITLFEISQLYGSSTLALLLFLCALPLLIFSTQWIALPLGFIIMILGAWLFFDLGLWLPDSFKRLAIGAQVLRKILQKVITLVEKVQSTIPLANFYDEYKPTLWRISALCMIFLGFQIGFIQSPHTSYISILSMLLLPLDMLVDVGYLTYFGYGLFLIGLT